MSTRPAPPAAQAGEALARLLESERAARLEVERCARQAAAAVAEASARAGELHAQTEGRIERLRARVTATARRRLAALAAEADALAADPEADTATLARLDRAIAELVADLAGRPEEG